MFSCCRTDLENIAVGNASHHRPEAPIAIEEFGADEADSRKAEEKDYVDVGWLGLFVKLGPRIGRLCCIKQVDCGCCS